MSVFFPFSVILGVPFPVFPLLGHACSSPWCESRVIHGGGVSQLSGDEPFPTSPLFQTLVSPLIYFRNVDFQSVFLSSEYGPALILSGLVCRGHTPRVHPLSGGPPG